MDPLTAVSLASAIVQFIDFGSKIVSKGHEIYQAVDGVLPYNQRLQESITRIDRLCIDLGKSPIPSSATSQNERAIRQISNQCIEVARELRTALIKLQAKPKSASSSLRKALKTVWSDKDIRGLEKRLSSLYTELQLCLTATLRDGQSELMATLTAMTKTQAELQLRNQADVMALKQDLLKAINASTSAQHMSKTSSIPGDLDALASKMANFAEESSKVLQKTQLLQSLVFGTMQDRQRNVQTKHGSTFDWIFDESHASKPLDFSKWLQKREGIFWISGKAGSGKSTLMKAICNDRRTAALLQDWAGNDNLITASYFFWNAGNKLDKSQEGLLRKILFDILSRNPDMIPGLVGTLSEHYLYLMQVDPRVCPWPLDDLLSALLHLVSTPPVPTRFCFFLDGLDEYDGEPRELARALKKISVLPNVKLCVSSRDWPAFNAEFGENSGVLSLTLHEHTKDDIRLYIHEVLEEDPIFARLRKEDDRYEGLIAHLVSKSQGVFLWIFLVVRDLSNSLPNKDSFEDLLRRVDQFPDDLDPFFLRMLDSVQPFYWKSSAEILLVCLSDDRTIDLMALRSFTEDQSLADAAELRLQSDEEWMQMRLTMITRVKARSLDLIDLYPVHGHPHVQFIHRTVYDFLRQDHIYQKLRDRVNPEFRPGFALCKGYHSYLKSLPENPRTPFEKSLPTSIIDRVLVAAGKLETPRQIPSVNAELYTLFDNIEQTLSQLSQSVGTKYRYKDPFYPFNDSYLNQRAALLVHAVSQNFVGYAALRFKRDPSLAQYLVRDDPTLYTILLAQSDVEMVQLVLSYCPEALNWSISQTPTSAESTVWGEYLYELGRMHQMETEVEDKKRLGRVVICLVEAGANLGHLVATSWSTEPKTAMYVCRELLLPQDVEVLKGLYAQQVKAKRESTRLDEAKPGGISRLWRWLT